MNVQSLIFSKWLLLAGSLHEAGEDGNAEADEDGNPGGQHRSLLVRAMLFQQSVKLAYRTVSKDNHEAFEQSLRSFLSKSHYKEMG